MSARLRDPGLLGCLVFSVLAVAGLVLLVGGGFAADGQPAVLLQVPVLASAGLGGLALVVAGAGLLTAHVNRQLAADERRVRDALIVQAAAAVVAREGRTP